MSETLTLTGQQAAIAQTALRQALGLPPEHFSVQAFIGMISDEIERLRAAGNADEAIASLVSSATGELINSKMITCFYASPEARGHHEEHKQTAP